MVKKKQNTEIGISIISEEKNHEPWKKKHEELSCGNISQTNHQEPSRNE